MKATGTVLEMVEFLRTLPAKNVISIEWEPVARVLPMQSRPRAIQANANTHANSGEGGGGCAVKGCTKDVKSLNFCGSHYLKYNNLVKTGRAEQFGWVAYAPPGSLENPVLPRGRAPSQSRDEESEQGEEVPMTPIQAMLSAKEIRPGVTETVKAVPPTKKKK
jgi:hypothetical protein